MKDFKKKAKSIFFLSRKEFQEGLKAISNYNQVDQWRPHTQQDNEVNRGNNLGSFPDSKT